MTEEAPRPLVRVVIRCSCGRNIGEVTFDGPTATLHGEQLDSVLEPNIFDRRRGPGPITDADMARAVAQDAELPIAYELEPLDCTLEEMPEHFDLWCRQPRCGLRAALPEKIRDAAIKAFKSDSVVTVRLQRPQTR